MMYDTRWPRPGPALAAVGAVVGLLVGIALGLSSGGVTRAAGGAPATTVGRVTTTLPREFWTVVLGSYNERSNATEALASFRGRGVEDAALLRRDDYGTLRTAYAVSSGRFDTSAEARAHVAELASRLGITGPFPRKVRRA